MNRSALNVPRRLGAALATLVVTLGLVATVGTPAQAAPPGCQMGSGYYVDGSQNIFAYRYWFCDNGNDIPLSVSIQRYVSPGVWTTVASGTGETAYYCDGHAYNVYKTTGQSQFANTCG